MEETLNTQNKNTVGMFDFARGIGMLSVILGHTVVLFSNNVGSIVVLAIVGIIGYGAISMFIMCSGYGFRKRKVWSCMKQQLQFILKPYIIVTFTISFLFPCVHYAFFRWWPGAVSEMIREVLAFCLGISGPSGIIIGRYELYDCGAMWFALALMNSWIIMNLIFQIKNERVRTSVVVGITLVGYLLSGFGIWPYCFQQSLYFVGYLYVGYEIKKKGLLWKKIPAWIWCIFGTCWIIGGTFGRVSMADNVWKMGLLDVIFCGMAGFVLMRGAIKLNSFSGNLVIRFIQTIGKYSLWVMCVHTVESICFPWYLVLERCGEYRFVAMVAVLIVRGMLIALGVYAVKTMSMLFCKIKVRRKYCEQQN